MMKTRRRLYIHLNFLCSDSKSSWVSIFLGSHGNAIRGRLESFIRTAGRIWGEAFGRRQKELIINRMQKAEPKMMESLTQSQGPSSTVLYSSGESTRIVTLPGILRDLIVTADRPHVKPIFHILQKRQPFWIMQLEHGFTQLHRSDGFEVIPDARLPSFYSGGEWDTALLRRIRRTIQRRPAPILLAGSPTFCAMAKIRMPNETFMHNAGYGLVGPYTRDEFISRSMDIVEEYFESKAAQEVSIYAQARRAGRTSTDPDLIVHAINQGELQHLYLAGDFSVWGRVNWDSERVHVHLSQDEARDNDILGLLAQKAFQKNLQFTLLPVRLMPDQKPMAAVLSSTWFSSPYQPAWQLASRTTGSMQPQPKPALA